MLSTGLLALLVLPTLAKTALLPGNNFKPHLAIVGSEGTHKLLWQLESVAEPRLQFIFGPTLPRRTRRAPP